MKRFVLDDSALIAFLEDRTGAEEVEQLLGMALDGAILLLVPVSTWSSVCRTVWRKKGKSAGDELLQQLSHLPLSFVELDQAGAEKAADIAACESETEVLTAFAAAVAFQRRATLVTANSTPSTLGQDIRIQRIGNSKD